MRVHWDNGKENGIIGYILVLYRDTGKMDTIILGSKSCRERDGNHFRDACMRMSRELSRPFVSES